MPGTTQEGQASCAEDISVDSGKTLTLGLYTNPVGTLSETSVLADVAQATPGNQPGYAAVTLNKANFSVDADGTITYIPAERFTATGAWTSVTGAYISDGTRLRWYSDFSVARVVDSGEILTVDLLTEV